MPREVGAGWGRLQAGYPLNTKNHLVKSYANEGKMLRALSHVMSHMHEQITQSQKKAITTKEKTYCTDSSSSEPEKNENIQSLVGLKRSLSSRYKFHSMYSNPISQFKIMVLSH